MLSNIRKALEISTEKPFPLLGTASSIFETSEEEPEMVFVEAFTKAGGHFIFNDNFEELAENLKQLIEDKGWEHLFCWHKKLYDFLIDQNVRKIRIGRDLKKAEVGITTCEAIMARTGSVLLSSRLPQGRQLSVYPPVHIIVAESNQLVPDIGAALELVETKYEAHKPSMLSVMTGPSRTADIEKTLVLGAHGPKEVYLFWVDNF